VRYKWRMGDAGQEPPFHMHLEPDEAAVVRVAIGLLISDEAHAPEIRAIARDLLALLDADAEPDGRLALTLTPHEMKIMHSAARLLLNDTQREQADERAALHRILDKLPDEHVMRAILID
jgi:hypothetical protein